MRLSWQKLLTSLRRNKHRADDALSEGDCVTIRELAWARLTQGNRKEAFEIVQELIERLEQEGLTGNGDAVFQRAASYRQLAHFHATLREPEQVPEPAHKAIELFQQRSDPLAQGSLSVVLGDLGTAYYNVGRLDEARTATEQSLAIERSLNRKREIISPLLTLAAIAARQNQSDTAAACYAEAVTCARAADEPGLAGLALQRQGVLCRQSDPAQAAALFGEALTAFDAAGLFGTADYSRERLRTLHLLAAAETAQAHWAAAEARYTQAQALAVQLADRREQAALLHALSTFYQTRATRTPDETEAHIWLRQALAKAAEHLALSQTLDHHPGQESAHLLLGELHRQLAEPAPAEQHLLAAAALADKTDSPQRPRIYAALAELADGQGYAEIAARWRNRAQQLR